MIYTNKSLEAVRTSIVRFSEKYDFHLKEDVSKYILSKEYKTFTMDGYEQASSTIIVSFKLDVDVSNERISINSNVDFVDDFKSEFIRNLNINYEKNSEEFLIAFEYALNCLLENNMPISEKLELIKGNTFTGNTAVSKLTVVVIIVSTALILISIGAILIKL